MKYLSNIHIIAIGVLAASCTDTPDVPAGDNTAEEAKFIIAATVQDSKGSSNVLLTAESLDEGQISAVGNGLINDGATQWVFHGNKYLYALTYNQGNAATTRSYILGNDGAVKARDLEYKVSRYSAYGINGNEIITTSTGDGPKSFADANGYLPKTLLMTHLDVVNETSLQNNTADGSYNMENYLGNGEYVTLAGLTNSGGRIYTGVFPMGLSQYGAAAEGGKWIRPGFEHLVATADGGSNSSAYKKGELQGTQYPDECWVAIYKDNTMTNPILAKSNRLSSPAGRFKSQYYQSVWASESGNVYVFSPSYSKIMTDARQRTSLPAAVGRIPAGTTSFDDYYFDIEAAAGGRSFMRVWPAGGERFLLQMYDRPFSQSGYAATDFAIFDAAAKQLTFVKNLPADIESIGSTVHNKTGKIYVSISAKDSFPAIYAIDTATATATKGLTVEASTIAGFGLLNITE